MEVVAPLENDPILSGRLIWSFRQLELQNPSIISDFRDIDRMLQQKCGLGFYKFNTNIYISPEINSR